MDGQKGGAPRPSWLKNLVPHRWRDQAPTSELFGPASPYAAGQVEQRLRSPEWTEARSPRADDARRAPVKRPTFPPDDRGAPPANRRPYPA